MPYTKHRDWFPIYLHDYRVTVSKIIPACLRSEDEGLIDDVYHALDLRSRLEEELNKHPKLERYCRSIKEVDEMLLAQKEMLVKVLGDGNLQHYRAPFSPPSSHWWWYLDSYRSDYEATSPI